MSNDEAGQEQLYFGQTPYEPPPAEKPKKPKQQFPQTGVDNFWNKFATKFPGKVHTILPGDVFAKSKAAHGPKGVVHGQAALKSYDQARDECKAAVEKIAKECRRVNMRYRDPHFDIEFDLKWRKDDCLEGLGGWDGISFTPNSVKRVPEIFEKPQFYVEGITPSDVRQGNDGDCWFLSALCALANKKGLIEKVCVARDEQVGVYGFVFHRDGAWIQTIIDDKLYLNSSDYEESKDEKFSWDQVFNRQDAEEEYRKAYQTGSRALYFAQCSNENETWLPLMEKAFAKAHGDYRAIYGGFTGEAIEDLTGGVTTELFTSDVLDTDKFWTDEISKVNDEFLFGCATGCFDNWKGGARYDDRKGVVPMHAYSIMEAREVEGERLLKIRNPWGKTEWQGAWSDGSEQWTPRWMELLEHRFGNDGIFWISYQDLLRKYQCFDRTRLFGPEWTIAQQWTSVDVPWTADYNDTKFTITISEKGPIVVVLSQLNDRYFRGLQGQYDFSLHFRLDKEGENDYIVRSHGNYLMSRSVSTDLELEAGTYSVLMKITARRDSAQWTPERMLRENCRNSQEKLIQIGLAYDLAHAKGQIKETEQEKINRAESEAEAKKSGKKKQIEVAKEAKYRKWLFTKRQHERNKRHKQKAEDHRRKKLEEREAVVHPDKHVNGGGTVNHSNSAPTVEEVAVAKGSDKPEEESEEARAGTHIEGPSAPTLKSVKESIAKHYTTQDMIDQFNKDLKSVPSVQVNGTIFEGEHMASPSTAPPPTAPDFSDTSSILSYDSSVDSVLDLEPLEIDLGNHDKPADPEVPQPLNATVSEEDADDDNEEFANDPWNAVCVVGLRVFSKDKNVSVVVVRPKNGGQQNEKTPLDLDDISKGLSDTHEAETNDQLDKVHG